LEEETEAMNETQEEVMDRNTAADLEAKKCIKEKAMKAAEEENIRKRLRSQGDMNMMDKAKDLASKKNLDKGNDLPTVLNSSISSLCDLAASMKINIGHDIEKRMQTIDIRDFYFRALGSLVVLSFPQLLSFSSVFPKPLSETLTRSSDGRNPV
jgi:hypothetical protein